MWIKIPHIQYTTQYWIGHATWKICTPLWVLVSETSSASSKLDNSSRGDLSEETMIGPLRSTRGPLCVVTFLIVRSGKSVATKVKKTKSYLKKEFVFLLLSIKKESYQNLIDISKPWNMITVCVSILFSTNHNFSYPNKRMLLWTTGRFFGSSWLKTVVVHCEFWIQTLYDHLTFLTLDLQDWFVHFGITISDFWCLDRNILFLHNYFW